MGFAACTNEVEEFNTQTANVEATDLGKDFVIGVTKSEFNADAETRAALTYEAGKWIAAWGKDANGNPDAIGAAWFNKSKWENGNYVSGSACEMYIGGEYASNNKFVHQEGNMFVSEANSKTGAYVLYYPFDQNITDNMAKIPVKPIKENKFDCNEIEKYVNQNIFAANIVNFKKSGTQAPVFTVKQIPVLYAISFYIKDESLLALGDKMEVTHVLIEATAAGKPAINTEGIVQPQDGNYVITNDQYKELKPMTEIQFVGEESSRIGRMMIEVENSNDDYCIRQLGQDGGTANFYFSMLPTEEFDKVTFKVVTKIDGKKTVVFSKTQEKAQFKDFSASVQKMAQSGQVVNLGVALDHIESVENGIYSEEQFIEYWKAGETEFDIQVPGIDLSDNNLEEEGLDFTLPEDKAVTFKGMPITLPAISGNYTFAQNVEIKGDATFIGGKAAEINVTGNLTVDGGTKGLTIKKATVGGKLTTNGKVTISGASQIKSSVTVASGSLSLAKGTEVGSISVNKHKELGGATLTATGTTIKSSLKVSEGAEAIMKGTWSASSVTVNGKLTQVDPKANGTVTKEFKVDDAKANESYPELNMTAGKIDMKSLVVSDDVTSGVVFGCQIISTGNITAKSPVTFNGEIESVGNVTADAAVTFGNNVETVGNITATKDVTFNGTVTSVANIGTADVPATGKVSFNGAAKSIASITTKAPVNFTEATIEGNLSVTGEGVEVNADNLTVKGTVDLNEQVTLTAPTLTANAIELDTYCQLTANTKLEVSGLLNATGKVNAAGESKITTLTIEPNVVVDLAKANINTLNVNKKLTYVGTLNATDLTVAGGVNNGVINATSTTIIGAFTQSATLNTDAITVAKDTENNIHGNLTINADMDKAITNKGTVTVKAEKSVTTTSFINDGEIIVEGTVSKVTNNVNAKVTVKNGGNFTINGKNNGSIYLENGAITSKITNDANGKTIYKWSDAAPEATIIGKINALELDGVTLGDTYASIYKKALTVDVKGTITVPENANLYAWTINVVDNAQFTTPTESTVTIKTVNVKENKTLGTAEITTLVGKSDIEPATITLGKGATFNGNKGANVNVTM